jgi:Flagellar capping protein
MVTNMLAASKAKISAVQQKKQILEWKQEFYKEITTNLYNFQKKYFSGSTSLLGDALTSLKATSSSSYVTATSSSASSSGSIYIDDIISLASNTKIVSDTKVSANPTIEINSANLSALAGKSIVVNLNGSEKTLVFSDKSYNNVDDVKNELQTLINSSFGSDKINVSLDDEVMTLSTENSKLILKAPTTDGSDPSDVLTFDSFMSNRIDMNVSLASAGLAESVGDSGEFTINGKTFDYSSSDTLNSIITKINSSDAGVKVTYSQLTDKFTMTSTETGVASDISFSDTSGNFLGSLFGDGIKTKGTDAVVNLSVNGSTDSADIITVTRSTNTIDIDGTTITLNGKADGDTKEAINITLSRDNDAIIEKIKSFVSDYNTLLSSITGKLSEEYDSDYLPLTDDQKSAMNDDEIESWTTKAKTGLLNGDTYLNSISAQLRSIFYTQVSSLAGDSTYIGALSDIGIATTNYSDKGNLTVDETKLKNALNSDPDKVINLFTQKSSISYSLYSTTEQQNKRNSESGILDRLSDTLKTNLNTIGKKGALINLVGSPTDTYSGNTDYSKRIQALDDKIDKMNDDLADEEDRYWKQFTAMETALQKLNQQSNWITSMMGNSNSDS